MECIGKNVTVHMMDVMEQIQSCKLVFDKSVKVPILKEVTSEKLQLCRVEHFFNIFVLTFGRDCVIAITPKNEDKYAVKVFNSTEFTSFKIGTLAPFHHITTAPSPPDFWTVRRL